MLEKASQNYSNLFDPETRLMRGRNADGTFQSPFSPYKWGDAFTEGNAWHYTWSVFHDVEGLIDLMGGREGFTRDARLGLRRAARSTTTATTAFRIHEITEMQVADMGNYAHGNQPAQHMIYLYDYAGQPRGRRSGGSREVMDRLYSAKPDGYCGDEDNGQTSAWYVFSALGFYPVCPGSDEYAVGSPLFRKATDAAATPAPKIVIEAPANGPADALYRRRDARRRAVDAQLPAAGRTWPTAPWCASRCRPNPTPGAARSPTMRLTRTVAANVDKLSIESAREF